MLDLDTVYREEGALVYKYLCTLCHDEQLAEELTQETFYQALRSCDRFDGSCKVSTWLCQIAKHLWYRELERRRKHAEPLAEDIPAVDPTAEEQLQSRETVVELFRRAHDLSAEAREVFLLRLAGELSFREIGEIFGRSENWARVTYYRAKQKVTEGWDRHEM
ncbi:MAG: sigma-70 family RNA polymerase sigma factor [Oscillospiraceae bacterium]|nr:sigma-70 family RNA polymerase sigma factor [Oscillospiraceae bacterium]